MFKKIAKKFNKAKTKTLFLLFITLYVVLTVNPNINFKNGTWANAQELPQNSISSVISAYRFYKDINNISINTRTVVEIPFADEFIERFDFAILDKTANFFEPYFFKQTLIETPVSVSVNPNISSANRMNDNNTQTYGDFSLPDNMQGHSQIILSSAYPITSSVLTVLLDNNVALPSFIEIRAVVDGKNRIVVANKKMDQQTIRFPKTTSDKWMITFTFGQPLRVSELRLNQDNVVKSNTSAIRFLAQPDHSYRIYFDPDRQTKTSVLETGNLVSVKDILIVPASFSQNNPNYIIADMDNDGVPDVRDNCVSVFNLNQQDINNNGIGDVCDDFDQDGLINSKDNCLNNPNRDQKDLDNDGIGDVCDKEESRITERYTWIPWAGIGFAAIVLIVLFVLTAKSTYVKKQNSNK